MPASSSRFAWPLIFALQPSNLSLLEDPDYLYDLEREFQASAEEVVRTFFDNSLATEVPGLLGFNWHTAPGDFRDAIVDEQFTYMTLRMRTVAYQPGLRLATSIDRCSLPLGRQMLQVMDTTPLPGGGCHFRWRIAVRYLPGMAALAPAVTPLFKTMFEQTFAAVERCTAR